MSKNCFWTTDCGNGLQTFSFIVKGQRTKVESFFDNRLSKTTSTRDNKFFSFEPRAGITKLRNGFVWQKSKVEGQNSYHPQPLSCKHKPATALLVVLLTRSLVGLKTTGYHPKVRSLLSVVLKEQISLREGIREVGQMRKRLFIQLLTATYALRFGFAKIQRLKLPLSTYVHLCPLMSTYSC